MSEPKHTPGPWVAASSPSSVVGWPICGKMGRIIGDVACLHARPGTDAYAEVEANAHLIAAAPDLLAALKRCVVLAAAHPGGDDPNVARANAAIAKAEGRDA